MHNLKTVALTFCLVGMGFCHAQLSDLPAPAPSTILQLTVGTDIKMTIAGTNSSWLCIPEFSSNLVSQAWSRVPFYSNTVANGTNIMEFDRPDGICGSNVLIRIRQTSDRGAAYQGPPPLVANTWGYAGASVTAVAITNIV